MNAAKTMTRPEADLIQIREIATDDIFASPDNPRKTIDPEQLAELAATMRIGNGIQVPLLVRPAGKSFEIVCGHRRYAAAVLLEMISVPCIVRDMTDDVARETALVDNLQRVDVPALEEAEAFDALLRLHGTAEAVAKRVGKEVAHVAKRLKLVTLGEHSRRALAARLITVDHALLLARLGVDEENAALKWALDSNAGVKTKIGDVVAESVKQAASDGRYRAWEPQSVPRLRQHIEQSTGRKLKTAPWSLDDAELLVAAGPCNGCPSNTKSNTALFAEMDFEEATCADGICFESKRAAFVHIQTTAAANRDGKPPLRLSWKLTTVQPRADKKLGGPDLGQIFKDGQWVQAKKGSCEWARIGVTLDWKDDAHRWGGDSADAKHKPAEQLLVCVAEACKVHKKAWQRKASDSSSPRQDSAAQKAAEEKRRLEGIEEGKLRCALASAVLEPIVALNAEAIRVAAIALAPNWGERIKVCDALVPGFRTALKSGAVNSVEFAKALALITLEAIEPNSYGNVKDGRGRLLASAKRLGFKGATPWDKPPAAKTAKKAAKTAGKKTSAKKAAAKKAAKK
jgi:ParB family chromosome partitioning protein